MGRLRELKLDVAYRTGSSNLVEDFYVPCLSRASLYRRAVGYFTSHGLSLAAQGIAALVANNDGQVRLIASPYLTEEDVDALRAGYVSRRDVLRSAARRGLADVTRVLSGDRLEALAWLVSQGRMEVRLAVRVDARGAIARGLYHEKVGVFTDRLQDGVAFTGSANETEGGLLDNFESIDVYWSWEDPQGRVLRKTRDFEKLWAREVPGLEVVDFSDVTDEILRPYRSSGATLAESPGDYHPRVDPWRHQDEAIRKFLEQRRGVLEMATGTGKTRVALKVIERLVDSGQVNSVIVAAFGNDLLDQWAKQLDALAVTLPRHFRVLRHYGIYRKRDEYELDPKNCVLAISRTELPGLLRKVSRQAQAGLLLVHDEVHGLGSTELRQQLHGLGLAIPYRLGLSATPDREYDEEGNAFIRDHVGPVVYRFGLEDAIRQGILCEFDYQALEYTPTADDRQRIQNVYKQRAAREREGRPMSQEEAWIALARVYKTSLAKVPLFADFIARRPEVLDRCVVFVAEKEYGDRLLEIIHSERHEYHTYYAEDDRRNLVAFANGDIGCLITCHRIAQGIDIRNLRSVILLSSDRGKLETTQRIGRCLRVDPDHLGKRAFVLDFVRCQDSGAPDGHPDRERCAWLKAVASTRRKED